jgi:hypothetical protein
MKEEIGADLRTLVSSGEMTPDTLMKVSRIVELHVENWRSGCITQLESMVREWEETMGDEDKSFYSLGLRRAIDVLNGKSALSQLPVLETPETKLDTE